MKSLNRVLACILLIVMLFTMLPVDGLNVVNADSGITQGNTNSIGGGGLSNPTGGGGVVSSVDGSYNPTFRVSINRHESVYNNGTPEVKEAMIEKFKYKYPDIDTYRESLLFEAYDVPMGVNKGSAYYVASSKTINWSTVGEKRNIIVKLKSSPSDGVGLNKVKIKLLNEDGYGTPEKPISSLSGDAWQSYLDDISYEEAILLWSYILGENSSGYHVDDRIDEVISIYVNEQPDLSKLETWKREDIAAGYVGVLMSLYKIAQVQNVDNTLGSIVGNYYIAIEEYLSNVNTKEKPVGIIIDTAIPMVLRNISSEGTVYLHIPSIDYVEYTALIPEDASIQSKDGEQFVKNNIGKYSGIYAYGKAGIKGVTRNQLIAGASESLEDIPLEETKYGDGPVTRIADYAPYETGKVRTDHQIELLKNPFCWGGTVPGWNRERLLVGRGWAESFDFSSSSVDAGFMEMMDFYSDGTTDIDGFLITSYHLMEDEPKIYYTVASSLSKMREDQCDATTYPDVANQITFVVKAGSGAISVLEARMKNGETDVTIDIKGNVMRETYVNGNLTEDGKKKEIVTLSNELKEVRTGEALLSFLKGAPQVLHDTTIFTDEFERDVAGRKTVTYKYYIENLEVKIGTTTYKYGWEQICSQEYGVYMNYAEHSMSAFRIGGEPVEDIVIPKPSSITDLSIDNPSINEVESTLINRYDVSTGGNNYAEVKSNIPNNEKYEVMAGIPSTEEIYFSAGGSEFKLALVLQYWMNEKGVDRTYRSHYSGTSCEFKERDQAKDYTVPSPTGATSSNLTVNGHKGGKVYAEWSYTVKNTSVHSGLQGYNAGKAGSPCAGNGFDPGNPGDITWTDEWTADVYNDAVQNAKDWQQAVNDFIVSYTSASDKKTREWHEWNASLTGNIWGDSISTTEWASYTKTMGQYGKGSGYDAGCGHSGCTIEWDVPPVPPDKDGKGGSPGVPHIHKHSCGSFTPATKTTVTKTGDKSFRIRVEATLPAHVVCGPCCEHELPAVEDTWKQGIVYDYVKISQIRLYKIDQASVTGMTELTGTDEIFANIKSGDPTYFLNIAQLNAKADPIQPDSSEISNLAHRNTIFSGANRAEAQSSKYGRLRYSLDPTKHDVVVWDEGVRSNKCDGLGKTKSVNVKPAGGNGHVDQFWATGTLYTNGTYANDYNHHMPRPGVSNKSDYSDRADDIDKNTIEWKKFDERRRTKNVATVISDFLILQTSGGDQSIFYFHKQTEPTETQEHFQKMKATEEEMFTENINSIFNKAVTECISGKAVTTAPLKYEVDFINIGGYNGNYKDVTKGPGADGKYAPYNYLTKKKLTVNGYKVATFVDADPANTIKRPARTGQFMMYEDKIQIKPTASNKIYTPNQPKVFYKQVIGYFTNDLDRLDTTGKRVAPLFNLVIGLEAGKQSAENLVKWGDSVGLQYNTTYSSTIKDGINSVLVYTPVSAEDATILPLKGIDLNGDGDTNDEGENRDQRADGVEVVDLNAQINKFKICPLDPGLCEFRILNCKFFQDTKLAEFDFEPTYKVTERQNVNGTLETVEVTKNNTYQSGGKWITTNKVTGIEYTLPTGFTIGSSGVVGTGKYLKAFGQRWSIPFSDLGISNDKSNRVAVSMDFFMNANAPNKSMLVSFWGYDFWVNPNDGATLGVFNTGAGFEGLKGAATVAGNGRNKKVHLDLVFGFNNVMDCSATIDGLPASITVKKTAPVWETIGGIRKLVNKVSTVTSIEDAPENITKELIGNTINIGGWGANDNYPANFYIDNLEIWLKGGTHEHNSSCYTKVKIHETSKIHVHDDKCYTKEDRYATCTGELNANYQLRDDFVGGTLSKVENFSYTSSVQTFIAPATGEYTLEVWGAQGGNDYGGKGGYSKGTVTLNKGEVLRIYVGGQGGYNGGGSGNQSEDSGGGATDIRVGGTSLYNRLIVAGGGGGYGGNSSRLGGDGGGTTGSNGLGSGSGSTLRQGGKGATQSSGGSGGPGVSNGGAGKWGEGGSQTAGSSSSAGGGGGGGYYGGGAGGNDYPNYDDRDDGAGGGGSGYVLTSSSYKPSGYKLGSKYYLKNTSMLSGNRSGNGYAKISYNITKTPQGTSGLDYPNGDYTKPTKHKHTTACGLVKKGTLQCTGELNTISDFNNHKHTSECLTTAVTLPTVTFNYTGDAQSYTVPADGYYTLKAWGASGGGDISQQLSSHKGLGGYTEGKVYLKKGEKIYVYVGGEGKPSTALNTGGGWNGGGHGGANGFGGGGATDFRLSRGYTFDEVNSLYSRIMVSGGGGGADNLGGGLGTADDGSGGAGGGLIAGNARLAGSLITGKISAGEHTANTTNGGGLGQGGSQVGGYRFGKGESVTRATDTGGAGGGYWGGTVTNHNNGGAGGGSSYISGYAGANSVDMYGVHTGNVKHYSGKLFTNTVMQQGVNNGNGKAMIIPETVPASTLLTDIINGDIPLNEMNDYLGEELMGKLWGTEKLMFTWSNWTSSNMKGIVPVGTTLTPISGNLRVVQHTNTWEMKVPVSIPKGLISRIEVTFDNKTSATEIGIAGHTTINSAPLNAQISYTPVLANTNNQTVTIIPKDNWAENINALWFNLVNGRLLSGSMTIKSIKLYGYGTAVPGTGEVQTVTIKTPEQTTETTTVPKYMKKTTVTRYTNGVAGTPSVSETEVTALGSPSTTDKTISTRTKLVSNGDTWEFSYTGGVQTFNVPASGNYKLEVYGAQGEGPRGGLGGYARGNRSFTAGATLRVYVGGQTGYNGGGTGYYNGGGGTDIRTSTALSSRVIVAGGGGGTSNHSSSGDGGAGGGTTGGDGTGRYGGPGGGATQSRGGLPSSAHSTGYNAGGSGSLGQGGKGASTGSRRAGGGGGGYYGGAGGSSDYPNYSDDDDYAGGGGSGYTSGLSSATMTSGSRSGDGRAIITSLQDVYSGNDVFDRTEISYYETTKTTSTPKTVVKKTTQTTFESLKINFAATKNDFTNPGSFTFKAPTKGWYSFEGWGASGSGTNNTVSGKGGYTYGEIHLNKGETVYVYVGEKGTGNSEAYPNYTFNGGGYSGTVHDHLGGRGGGATDFRLNSGSWDNVTGLRSRIMVAGGGGGRGCASNHLINGDAGGLKGSDTLNGGTTYYGYVAKGGTQTGGLIGHRNGNTIGTALTKAGSFGKGAIDAQCGAGGGGGYYGGGSTYTAGGAGGSSFISGMAGMNAVNSNGTHRGNPTHYSGKVFKNTSMKAGNEVMPTPTGGTQVGHSGNGFARITFIPEKPGGEPIRQTILDNVDLIPSYLPNGEWNPIFLCKGIPYNEHICTDNCKTYTILKCTEPHHYGEHYDSSNRICWDACGNDDNHKLVKDEIEIGAGVFVKNARFLQIDHEFTVYFPNNGDFKGAGDGAGALGLSTPQSQTGYGYTNNMDTTQWTREKRVKFPFNVIYKGEMYVAGNWIELEVREEYFDFYLVLANYEASNAPVEFEVEAINAGVDKQKSLQYRASLATTYANALTNFKTSLEPKFIAHLISGYKANDETASIQGYKGYFVWKQGQETSVLTKAKNDIKSYIWRDFNGGTGVANTNDGTKDLNSINERAKPITTNDNRNRPSNVLRSSSLESLHGGYKYFYLDVVGRIGNFAIVDTEDYRFSNFFKLPKTDPAEWLVEGFIYKVEEQVQNNYLGDMWDIRGNKISTHTKWLNTYGTQTWMQGTFESGRNVNNPNIKTQILSGGVNNIEQLKKEQLRFGYDIYASISTIGDYQKGRVLVTPYYYALNLETGSIVPLDVFISKDGVYEPVNIFNNSTNGEYNTPVYEYNMNLDWTTESDRRNFLWSEQEYTETQRVAEFGKRDIYDYGPYNESNMPPVDYEPTYVRTENYKIPSGAYNYLGNAQSMLLNASHRTFIGSEESNGSAAENAKWDTDKNPGGKLSTVKYSAAAQRWHFKIGVPSSSVFVRHGMEPNEVNISEIMDNNKYAVISTISVVGIGGIWDVEYKQPWVSNIEVNGNNYDISASNLPPIVAIFASDKSSVQDVDIIKTH